MPFNGSGTFQLAPGNPVNSGTLIKADWANDTTGDIAANGLSQVLPRDGQAPMIGPLKIQDGFPLIPSLSFNSEPRTGIWRPAAKSFAITVDGDLKLTVTDTTVTSTLPIVGITPTLAAHLTRKDYVDLKAPIASPSFTGTVNLAASGALLTNSHISRNESAEQSCPTTTTNMQR